ncbi:hypothetical protein KP509_10G000200 [Ceratopteris richardii]|uniref:Protein kinase domain-containing protein n=1 Tax=Ceratopteris richardii TaxID=49495 RepID=A0A8T2U146_CERRI|nr:hypothetical protein KP509_10G000200 [Ceratopteris richardii]
MGNCLNLWAVDEPYSSASAIARDCLGFDAILPFSTAADLAQLYELGCELGSGQSGVVCKCTDRASGIQFACKSISKLHLRTIANVRDVIREVNIMRRLSSRSSLHGPGKSREFNVVRLHDVVEDHSFVHLIVDLCSGGELFDRITRIKCYSEKKAAVIMKSLLESLQFCHSMGIMHRDVKPENLLLVDDSEEPNVKLADFGLALEFSPGQKFSNMAGSAYYMAPEVLRGDYSEEVDIWSGGVIMYVLLSGMPPFYGRTEQDIFKAIRRGQFDVSSDPWQWISHSAKDLIAKMLCVDVLSRCTIAQALRKY